MYALKKGSTIGEDYEKNTKEGGSGPKKVANSPKGKILARSIGWHLQKRGKRVGTVRNWKGEKVCTKGKGCILPPSPGDREDIPKLETHLLRLSSENGDHCLKLVLGVS